MWLQLTLQGRGVTSGDKPEGAPQERSSEKGPNLIYINIMPNNMNPLPTFMVWLGKSFDKYLFTLTLALFQSMDTEIPITLRVAQRDSSYTA